MVPGSVGTPPLDVLDRGALHRWAVRAVDALDEEREEIDALNVFPVPDGDTGTNMYLTLDAALRRAAGAPAEDQVPTFARAVVLGARGNSGVIVSQLVRGLLDVLQEPAATSGAGPLDLARALARAADLAYACVGEPTEGTILTVARVAATAAGTASQAPGASLAGVVQASVTAAQEALGHTPEQLDALRTAGVVDAGGAGLVVVLQALRRVVTGGASTPGTSRGAIGPGETGPAAQASETGDAVTGGPDGVGAGPRYEVVHTLQGAGDTALEELRRELGGVGDSVVVASSGALARVHVHTDDPAAVTTLSARYGDVDDVTVTDLHAQARRHATAPSWAEAPDAAPGGARTDGSGTTGPLATGPLATPGPDRTPQRGRTPQQGPAAGPVETPEPDGAAGPVETTAPVDSSGPVVIACTDGEGLRALFAQEGALVVTSRPGARASVGDLVTAAETRPGAPVLLLPDDPDVLLTARTAADELRATGRRVAVVPTRSDVAGLAALAVLDRGSDLDSAAAAMSEAAGALRSGAVAIASRASGTPVGPCVPGDVIGLEEDEVVLVGHDQGEVACRLVERMLDQGGELVSLVTGRVDAGVTELVEARCASRRPRVDVVTHRGGQSAYVLLVGVE